MERTHKGVFPVVFPVASKELGFGLGGRLSGFFFTVFGNFLGYWQRIPTVGCGFHGPVLLVFPRQLTSRPVPGNFMQVDRER